MSTMKVTINKRQKPEFRMLLTVAKLEESHRVWAKEPGARVATEWAFTRRNGRGEVVLTAIGGTQTLRLSKRCRVVVDALTDPNIGPNLREIFRLPAPV